MYYTLEENGNIAFDGFDENQMLKQAQVWHDETSDHCEYTLISFDSYDEVISVKEVFIGCISCAKSDFQEHSIWNKQQTGVK